MLKYYFRLISLIAIIIGFFAIIGSLLPRNFDFTSEMEIKAPAAEVFEQINQLENWQAWSMWNPEKIYGLKELNVVGESGVGNAMSWTEPRGSGKLWITKSDADRRIEFSSRMEAWPEMQSSMILRENEGVTTISWSSQGRLPNGPFYGFWASNFSSHLQHQYLQSLSRLKEMLEKEK